MSKRMLVAATALVLLWSVKATAQCHKRILLYVDMSGSMGQPPGPEAPFRQTIDAVQELLRIPGLIAETDELLLLPFSDSVGSAEIARGAQRGAEGLSRLGQPSANFTDLVAVFDDMARRLSQPSGADRELVIVASDFLHSPPPAARDRSWRQGVQARGTDWAAAVAAANTTGHPRVAVAFLRAPVRAGAADAQAFVEGLGALRPRLFQVGVRGQSAAGLARELSQLFYVPPDVSALLVGPQKFEVTARNAGCMPLTLRDAAIGCEGATDRDAVRAAFPEASRGLQGVSSAESVRAVSVDAARLSCPGAYEVKVSTEQGVVGTGKAVRDSRLEFEVMRAILGPQLGHDQLELRVKVWGAVTEPPEFEAALGLGAEARTRLAEGKLLPPRELATTPERARIYRIVVALDEQYQARLLHDGVTLAVQGSPSKPQHTGVRVDPGTWWSQIVGRPLAGVAGLVFLAVLGWLRQRRPLGLIRDFSDVLSLVMTVAPTCVLWFWGLASGSIYSWSDGAWLIEWRDAVGVVVVGWVVIVGGWWALREWAETRLRRALAEGMPVARTVLAYQRRVSFRWSTGLALALALATVAAAVVLHVNSPRQGDAAVATIPFVAR